MRSLRSIEGHSLNTPTNLREGLTNSKIYSLERETFWYTEMVLLGYIVIQILYDTSSTLLSSTFPRKTIPPPRQQSTLNLSYPSIEHTLCPSSSEYVDTVPLWSSFSQHHLSLARLRRNPSLCISLWPLSIGRSHQGTSHEPGLTHIPGVQCKVISISKFTVTSAPSDHVVLGRTTFSARPKLHGASCGQICVRKYSRSHLEPCSDSTYHLLVIGMVRPKTWASRTQGDCPM